MRLVPLHELLEGIVSRSLSLLSGLARLLGASPCVIQFEGEMIGLVTSQDRLFFVGGSGVAPYLA